MNPVKGRTRKIIIISFFREGAVSDETVEFGGTTFELVEHSIGWDFDTAESIIRQYDNFVDGFALSGIQKKASVGKSQVMHPGYLKLMRAAVKAPIYMADDIRDFFAEWTISRLVKEQPQFFNGKRALFHCGAISPWVENISAAGASLEFADPLLITGTPLKLHTKKALARFVRALKPLIAFTQFLGINPEKNSNKKDVWSHLEKWIKDSDFFVSFANLVESAPDASIFKDKVIIVDYLSDQARERLLQAGANQVIEFIPDHPTIEPYHVRHFSVLTALLDQNRQIENSELSLTEYLLHWVQESNVKPNRLKSAKGIVRRCAFIVHPLSQADLWREPRIQLLSKLPKEIRGKLEYVAARAPIFYYGSLNGATSESTGQEVVCDIYAYLATPKQLLSMNEEICYDHMVSASEKAKTRGAGMMGLGAYTKVIGDGGVTVAKRAAIPVTTGNSFSASTTLWAARVMVEKLGMVPVEKNGNRIRGKAVVVGATGSIGRVSALLISLVFDQIVLVATRADKLLELRQEIQTLSPGVEVRVTTHANSEISDADLIITATSNQGGKILDIEHVKPGAVICDCSRPLDITEEDARKRPDIIVIESGEVLLPGKVRLNCDIGLPKPSVYACLAETVLLTMEGRYESFSLSKTLSLEKVKEIYRLAVKHGAQLSEIRGPLGVITDAQIEATRALAREKLKSTPVKSSKSENKVV